VTGVREGLEEGVMGAWRIASGVAPGFHLPFSKRRGIGVGSLDSSEEEPLSSASCIGISRSAGWGVEEEGSGKTVS